MGKWTSSQLQQHPGLHPNPEWTYPHASSVKKNLSYFHLFLSYPQNKRNKIIRFLLSYPHHLPMSSSFRCPSLASPPSKQAKQAPPSPPAPPRPLTPATIPPVPVHTQPVVSDDRELSIFDILNVFWTCWFLNRDHLIANVLSAQKSDEGCYSWVDFQPPFHTHLVQCAQVLLPPLCPMAKGKKVMFVFILEVLDGTGPKPGSFWTVPKKHRHCLLLPKLPKVPPCEPPVTSASPAVPEPRRHEIMTGVEPSAPIDLPPPVPTPCPLVPPSVCTFTSVE